MQFCFWFLWLYNPVYVCGSYLVNQLYNRDSLCLTRNKRDSREYCVYRLNEKVLAGAVKRLGPICVRQYPRHLKFPCSAP
ncbi:hypothetical protein F4821DRAFT_102582 [Hypoxylon rubiginosum]|uniref:Uncharacterized protein n=1 Tax=Hypoxylon rubiginosum TaxID=110542 RepID=A0ACC0D4K7_9PEZI|nr:hypothetical protein F4821DRAFT_102582 [Hypoxylon rubiginosum]